MKKLVILLGVLFCIPTILSAQDAEENDYIMVELNYMKVKNGMDDSFQAAVHKHNAKYHPEGPYNSSLYYIAAGAQSGWYVWTMGPVTFTELDGAPGKGAHRDDWRDNVGKYVSEYGQIEYWKMKPKYSTPNADPDKMFVSWVFDIKAGGQYVVDDFMTKIQALYAKHPEDEMKTWVNVFSSDDGRDMAMNWSKDSWADLDNDGWNIGAEFDAEHGVGSWERALIAWREVATRTGQSVWMLVKSSE
jgi:hypothetical protein